MTTTDTKNPDAERLKVIEDAITFNDQDIVDCQYLLDSPIARNSQKIRAAESMKRLLTIRTALEVLASSQPSPDKLLLGLLQECLAYMYNPFEPDNQSKIYTRIKAQADQIAAAPKAKPPDQGQIEAIFIAIKNAEAFNRRECFADSQDGMKAFIEFGTLLDIAARSSELARGKGGV